MWPSCESDQDQLNVAKNNLTMVVSASKVMTTSKGEVAEEGIAIFV